MTDPTRGDWQTADDALELGVLHLFENGLGYVSPKLLDIDARNLPTAERLAARVLARWPFVVLAARRIVAASWHHRQAA